MRLQEYYELLEKIKDLKSKGYITTHRAGPTGIGKTLEDLLGIQENNIPGPNGRMIELKSGRKDSNSMLTLFTKSPMPEGCNTVLLQRFGYPSKRGNDRIELHTTLIGGKFNKIKGKTGLKLRIAENKIELVAPASDSPSLADVPDVFELDVLGYWEKQTLRDYFERKLPKLLYVKASIRGGGMSEEFWYDEAWLLSGFSFESLARSIEQGIVKVDIRIGQYPDGRSHDHGTAFRVKSDSLDLCFSGRERVV